MDKKTIFMVLAGAAAVALGNILFQAYQKSQASA